MCHKIKISSVSETFDKSDTAHQAGNITGKEFQFFYKKNLKSAIADFVAVARRRA